MLRNLARLLGRTYRGAVLSRRVAATSFCAAVSLGIASVAAQVPASSSSDPVQGVATYDGYRLRDGERIERLRLHYATLGTPHRGVDGRIDNAVLVLHWTGDSGASLLTPEYVQSLYEPGGPLDARRYYLVIPDNLGHGRSSKPSDGLRARFPHYGYGDLVDLQHKLVTETLGIAHLHAIVGMSMGGMNAWQWAETYPDAMDGIMPVVSLPVRVSGRNLLWRSIVINGIRNDPDWRRGDYTSSPLGFREGYQLLRMMIDGVPHQQATLTDVPAVNAYMAGIDEQVARADPNDLLYSLESSRDYDPEAGLSKIKAKVHALNFSDDEFNPDVLGILESRLMLVRNARSVVQAGSPESYGHLTMAHPSSWAAHVRTFMESLDGDDAKRDLPIPARAH